MSNEFIVESCHVFYVILSFFGIMYLFTLIYVLCEKYFIESLTFIGDYFGLSEDVQGATLLAIASSFPEFLTSLIGIFIYHDKEMSSPGPSTIIGSSMINLLIIGISCILFKYNDNNQNNRLFDLNIFGLFRDIIFYIISIMSLYVFYIIITPQQIGGYEGFLLVLIWIFYVISLLNSDKLSKKMDLTQYCGKILYSNYSGNKSINNNIIDIMDPITEENDPSNNTRNKSKLFCLFDVIVLFPCTFIISYLMPSMDTKTIINRYSQIPLPNESNLNKKYIRNNVIIFWLSIFYMSIVVYLLLNLVQHIGICLEITTINLSFTILAAGSSVPDTISSILLTLKGKISMIVSNCISSTIFNMTFVLGITFVINKVFFDINDNTVDIKEEPQIMLIQILFGIIFVVTLSLSKFRIKYIHGILLIISYLLFLWLYVIY